MLALVAVTGLLVLFLAGVSGPAALFMPMSIMGLANGLALPSAVSGAVSVRPDIAGAASGLSGAAQIGTGAVLSAVGGASLAGGASPLPMFAIMAAAAAFAMAVALAIQHRSRPR